MAVMVRPARFRDVPQLVALIERKRDEYQTLAPLFWKKAEKSAQSTRRYYHFLIVTRRATILVAEENGQVAGFLTAARARVPPVFDPGPTIFVDEFYVTSPERWRDIGPA